MANYLALIGDLKASPHIPGRESAQQEIKAALDQLNLAWGALMASPLTLTLGDEFQALLYPKAEAMRLPDELERALKDYPLRLGLGYGAVRTAIDPRLSIGADGECFWHAREALTFVHDNAAGGRSRARVLGFGELKDALLNGILQTTDALRYAWTATQRDTFHAMLAHGIYAETFDQQAFAQQIGISPSSLSKRLTAGNIKLYLRSRLLIGTAIEEWDYADR